MKAPPFAYVRAASLAEVFALWRAAGPEAQLLAGGQTLLATLAFRLSEPSTLIDISRVAELERHLAIGRRARRRRADHPRRARRQRAGAPTRPAAGRGRAADRPSRHPQSRHHRRIAGLRRPGRRAAGLLRGPRCHHRCAQRSGRAAHRRRAQFFTGLYATALAANELIAAVEFPVAQSRRARASILELARRSGDYAMAGIVARRRSASGTLADPRLVFFGVGEAPVVGEGRHGGARPAGPPTQPRRSRAAQAALDADLDPPADLHGEPGHETPPRPRAAGARRCAPRRVTEARAA